MTLRSRGAGWTVLLLAGALTLAGCERAQEAAPAAAPTKSLEQIKLELEDLASRFGEDAYEQPEIDEYIRQLDEVSKDSPNWKESLKLAEWLRAKRRIAWQVKDAPPPPAIEPNAPQYGPLKIEGAAPKDKNAFEAAEKLSVGAGREELLQAYGSCLVRQTWFPGENGGPTTELFQVKPECRDELKPRVFMVAGQTVRKVYDGNVDTVMNDREAATRGE